MKAKGRAEPLLRERITVRNFEECTMDFRLRRQGLLERAKRVEKKARRETNAQAQDLLRALAALYREMANELEEGSVIPSYMR